MKTSKPEKKKKNIKKQKVKNFYERGEYLNYIINLFGRRK